MNRLSSFRRFEPVDVKSRGQEGSRGEGTSNVIDFQAFHLRKLQEERGSFVEQLKDVLLDLSGQAISSEPPDAGQSDRSAKINDWLNGRETRVQIENALQIENIPGEVRARLQSLLETPSGDESGIEKTRSRVEELYSAMKMVEGIERNGDVEMVGREVNGELATAFGEIIQNNIRRVLIRMEQHTARNIKILTSKEKALNPVEIRDLKMIVSDISSDIFPHFDTFVRLEGVSGQMVDEMKRCVAKLMRILSRYEEIAASEVVSLPELRTFIDREHLMINAQRELLRGMLRKVGNHDGSIREVMHA